MLIGHFYCLINFIIVIELVCYSYLKEKYKKLDNSPSFSLNNFERISFKLNLKKLKDDYSIMYDPEHISNIYNKIAKLEDESEKKDSFRVLIPRQFILKYLKKEHIILDAAGGAGINSILIS